MSDATARFKASFARNLRFEHVVAMDACLECGSCGDACAWHAATGDARFHPQNRKSFLRRIHRAEAPGMRLLSRLSGKGFGPGDDEIADAMDTFWQCTTCGRCTMACPMGLDNRSLFHLARRAYNESGLMARDPVLTGVDVGSGRRRNSFDLDPALIFLRMGAFAAHAGVEIPMDVPGADYLFACSAVGNARLPDRGVQIPMLLNAAGIRYTLSTKIVDTGTDVVHVTDNHEIARAMILALEGEALRLGARQLMISECGCDARTFFVECASILGRPLRVPVRHVDAVLLESIRAGRLPVEPSDVPVTFHDPCKLVRLAGLGDMERALLHLVARDVREMEPHGARNLCCNGGSGPLRLVRNQDLRRRVSARKIEQLRAANARRVVSPCAVCVLTLADLCAHGGLGMRAMMMFELVFEAVAKALGPSRESFSGAPVLRGLSPEARKAHLLETHLESIRANGGMTGIVEAMRNDPATERWAEGRAGAKEFLERWWTKFGGAR